MVSYGIARPAYFRGETLRDDVVLDESGELVQAPM
jgi:hypothetical protein